MRGSSPHRVGRRLVTLPAAALLGLGIAGGSEAALGGSVATTSFARAVAVSAPVSLEARDGDRRREGHREGRRNRSRSVYRPYYGSFGGYGGFASFWPYLYSPYYYGPYAWGSGQTGFASPDAGAVDINTRPKKASVYLDGELVGRVGSFDGFPRYLWLRGGSYRLAIFMDGYETLERDISVHPGVVIKIDEELAPGRSEPPQPPPVTVTQGSTPSGESWRVENRGQPIDQDQRREPASLMVDVQPADAVVYLDGRLLGSGAQLASLHSALIIDPGAHLLEVARPGYVSEEHPFEAVKGEDVALRVELRKQE